MSQPLAGRVALVTGGSRGIGAAIVRRLARDGAEVAFTYAASSDAARALAAEVGEGTAALQADSADPDAVRQAVAETAARFGRIDILVSNAGILRPGSLEDYPLAEFDRMVAVNVRAPFVGMQAALPHMGRGGRMIVTGSVVAERAGFPGAAVYAMTKGALAAMVRGLARDLGPRGITVNAVAPGPTETDMNGAPGLLERLAPLMALGRVGTADEVASLAAWLAGPESAFVTGASLTVDGGYLA